MLIKLLDKDRLNDQLTFAQDDLLGIIERHHQPFFDQINAAVRKNSKVNSNKLHQILEAVELYFAQRDISPENYLTKIEHVKEALERISLVYSLCHPKNCGKETFEVFSRLKGHGISNQCQDDFFDCLSLLSGSAIEIVWAHAHEFIKSDSNSEEIKCALSKTSNYIISNDDAQKPFEECMRNLSSHDGKALSGGKSRLRELLIGVPLDRLIPITHLISQFKIRQDAFHDDYRALREAVAWSTKLAGNHLEDTHSTEKHKALIERARSLLVIPGVNRKSILSFLSPKATISDDLEYLKFNDDFREFNSALERISQQENGREIVSSLTGENGIKILTSINDLSEINLFIGGLISNDSSIQIINSRILPLLIDLPDENLFAKNTEILREEYVIGILNLVNEYSKDLEFISWLCGENSGLSAILPAYGRKPTLKRFEKCLKDLKLLFDEYTPIEPSKGFDLFGTDESKFFKPIGWSSIRSIEVLAALSASDRIKVKDDIKETIEPFFAELFVDKGDIKRLTRKEILQAQQHYVDYIKRTPPKNSNKFWLTVALPSILRQNPNGLDSTPGSVRKKLDQLKERFGELINNPDNSSFYEFLTSFLSTGKQSCKELLDFLDREHDLKITAPERNLRRSNIFLNILSPLHKAGIKIDQASITHAEKFYIKHNSRLNGTWSLLPRIIERYGVNYAQIIDVFSSKSRKTKFDSASLEILLDSPVKFSLEALPRIKNTIEVLRKNLSITNSIELASKWIGILPDYGIEDSDLWSKRIKFIERLENNIPGSSKEILSRLADIAREQKCYIGPVIDSFEYWVNSQSQKQENTLRDILESFTTLTRSFPRKFLSNGEILPSETEYFDFISSYALAVEPSRAREFFKWIGSLSEREVRKLSSVNPRTFHQIEGAFPDQSIVARWQLASISGAYGEYALYSPNTFEEAQKDVFDSISNSQPGKHSNLTYTSGPRLHSKLNFTQHPRLVAGIIESSHFLRGFSRIIGQSSHLKEPLKHIIDNAAQSIATTTVRKTDLTRWKFVQQLITDLNQLRLTQSKKNSAIRGILIESLSTLSFEWSEGRISRKHLSQMPIETIRAELDKYFPNQGLGVYAGEIQAYTNKGAPKGNSRINPKWFELSYEHKKVILDELEKLAGINQTGINRSQASPDNDPPRADLTSMLMTTYGGTPIDPQFTEIKIRKKIAARNQEPNDAEITDNQFFQRAFAAIKVVLLEQKDVKQTVSCIIQAFPLLIGTADEENATVQIWKLIHQDLDQLKPNVASRFGRKYSEAEVLSIESIIDEVKIQLRSHFGIARYTTDEARNPKLTSPDRNKKIIELAYQLAYHSAQKDSDLEGVFLEGVKKLSADAEACMKFIRQNAPIVCMGLYPREFYAFLEGQSNPTVHNALITANMIKEFYGDELPSVLEDMEGNPLLDSPDYSELKSEFEIMISNAQAYVDSVLEANVKIERKSIFLKINKVEGPLRILFDPLIKQGEIRERTANLYTVVSARSGSVVGIVWVGAKGNYSSFASPVVKLLAQDNEWDDIVEEVMNIHHSDKE